MKNFAFRIKNVKVATFFKNPVIEKSEHFLRFLVIEKSERSRKNLKRMASGITRFYILIFRNLRTI